MKAYLYTGIKNDITPGYYMFGGFFLDLYGHFLIETLSRIWYYFYENKTYPIDKIVFISDNPNMPEPKGNIKRILELSGILDKICVINCETSYENLIVPDMAFSHFWYADEFRLIFDIIQKKFC